MLCNSISSNPNISEKDTVNYLIPKNKRNMTIFVTGKLTDSLDQNTLNEKAIIAKNILNEVVTKDKVKIK